MIKPGVSSSLIIEHFGNTPITMRLIAGGKGTYKVEVFNVLGQSVFLKILENLEDVSREYVIELPERFPYGVYFVRLSYNGENKTYQIIR